MKKWPALILVVMWCFLAGCDNGTGGGDPEEPFYGLTSIEEVAEYLTDSKQDGTNPDNPVELAVKVSASEWEQLFMVIDQADKFVALDISRCYDVPQEFNIYMPYYQAKIVSLILPVGITTIRNGTFHDNPILRHIGLPGGLKTIGESAFIHCMGLTEIDLPASLTAIGGSAFAYCPNLTRVICRATTPPQMPLMAFDNKPDDPVVIEVPAASLAAYKAAWIFCADKIRSM